MYNKVFKNYQVNLGMPFQVKMPTYMQPIKTHELQVQTSHNEDDADDQDNFNPSFETENVLIKAEEEADLILKEAQLEAERILENAQNEAEDLCAAAVEAGKQQGYEQGYNEAIHQYEELIKQANEMKESAIFEYNQVLSGIENEAVDLILNIAKKVIGEEISINKENVIFLIKHAFERCSNNQNAIIKVSSEDYDYLIENKEKLTDMIEGIDDIEIKREASLKTGSCLIETPFGSVDAGVQTKLEKIEESFKQLSEK